MVVRDPFVHAGPIQPGVQQSEYRSYEDVRREVVGDPANGKLGMQDDCWTGIAPDLFGSSGSYLRDVGGDIYLDFCGFFGTAPLAFDHPALRSEAFKEQLFHAAMYRISLSDFWPVDMAEFVKAFRRVAGRDYLSWFFVVEGGGLAIENALKSAFDWKVRKNIAKGLIKGDATEEKRPLGTRVISFESAFHGRTGYTMSMTHTADPKKYKYFPKFDWFRVEPPVEEFDNSGQVNNAEQVKRDQARAIAEIKEILQKHPNDVGAILIEPMQAEGGDRHVAASFFIELRRLCDENDIILIYDEVQVGFGSSGRMWMHEYFGEKARPDVIAFAKKAQVAGIMASYKRFAEVEVNVFGTMPDAGSRLNSTWGGNPADMVRCTAILKAIEKERLLDNAMARGGEILDGLRGLCRQYPELICNPRGRGVLLAFDLKNPTQRPALHDEAMWKDEKLLSLTCGTKSIRFRPHLDTTRTEAQEAIEKLGRALSRIRS
jgi:L-lysine 6-transaminase